MAQVAYTDHSAPRESQRRLGREIAHRSDNALGSRGALQHDIVLRAHPQAVLAIQRMQELEHRPTARLTRRSQLGERQRRADAVLVTHRSPERIAERFLEAEAVAQALAFQR